MKKRFSSVVEIESGTTSGNFVIVEEIPDGMYFAGTSGDGKDRRYERHSVAFSVEATIAIRDALNEWYDNWLSDDEKLKEES